MTLQDLMIRYRAKHKLTQRELADKVGVTLQTINSVENGYQKPSKVTEAKIRLVVEEEE
ncbi:MAG TPA: transcriptional regulator [Erysipelotrichaceae bacterium]|nr:transcriptional regulator [Erysipelotrichaceae bacterium]